MSSIADFYRPGPADAREERYSIPLTGKSISIGPFPFRPRSIVLMNQTTANMIAQDDRGEQYIAAQSIGATYGVGDSIRFSVTLDKAVTSGKATVIVSDQPAAIQAAQLSSFAAIGGTGAFKRLALGSFPPAGPVDGDTWELVVDAVNGVHWIVVFNSADAFWYVDGGPPMLSTVIDTDESTTSATFAALATAGPSITIPRPGDYYVTVEGDLSNAGSGVTTPMGYDVGGVAAVELDAAQRAGQSGIAVWQTTRKRRLKTGLAAGTTLTAKYHSDGANAGHWRARSIELFARRIQ